MKIKTQGISFVEFIIIAVIVVIVAFFAIPKIFNSKITDDKIMALDAISLVSSAYKTCKFYGMSKDEKCKNMSDVVKFLEYKELQESGGQITLNSDVKVYYDPSDKVKDGSSVTITLPDQTQQKAFTLYLTDKNEVCLKSKFKEGVLGGIVTEDTFDPFK